MTFSHVLRSIVLIGLNRFECEIRKSRLVIKFCLHEDCQYSIAKRLLPTWIIANVYMKIFFLYSFYNRTFETRNSA